MYILLWFKCFFGSGLCSSSARGPQVTNFCFWPTKKKSLNNNEVLGTPEYIVQSLWAPVVFVRVQPRWIEHFQIEYHIISGVKENNVNLV